MSNNKNYYFILGNKDEFDQYINAVKTKRKLKEEYCKTFVYNNTNLNNFESFIYLLLENQIDEEKSIQNYFFAFDSDKYVDIMDFLYSMKDKNYHITDTTDIVIAFVDSTTNPKFTIKQVENMFTGKPYSEFIEQYRKKQNNYAPTPEQIEETLQEYDQIDEEITKEINDFSEFIDSWSILYSKGEDSNTSIIENMPSKLREPIEKYISLVANHKLSVLQSIIGDITNGDYDDE